MNENILRRFLVPAALLLGLTGAAGAQPVLLPGDGLQVIDRLVIGENLWVELQGGLPDMDYEVQLATESGEPLISAVWEPGAGGPGFEPGDGEQPSAQGRGLLLWPRSGVVGCDCGGELPKGRMFKDFAEAEDLLAGRSLRLAVVDPGGDLVASVILPAVAAQPARAYFSDVTGCSRDVYKYGEQIWMSLFLTSPPIRPSRSLVISRDSSDTHSDARGGAQEVILPFQRGLVTVPVDMNGLAGGGPFYGFLFEDRDPAGGDALPVDTSVPWLTVLARKGSEHPNGGIVITLDGCVSPP